MFWKLSRQFVKCLGQGVLLLPILLAAVVSAFFPCRADAGQPARAFVRVNQLYFLYTYPVVPYLDAHGVLMVGLMGIGRGLSYSFPGTPKTPPFHLSGSVKTDVVARRETLTFGGHVLAFLADSATVQVDGKAVPMKAAARWDRSTQHIVVPVLTLAQCLGLRTHWDPQRHVLSLYGPDALTAVDVQDFGIRQQDLKEKNTVALALQEVTFHPTDAPKNVKFPIYNAGSRKTPWIMIEAENVSQSVIAAEEMNVAVLFSGDKESSDLDGGEFSGRFRRGPDETIVSPGGVYRFPLALQTDPTDGAIPLCVFACPVSAGSVAQFNVHSAQSSGLQAVGIDPTIIGHERDVVATAITGLRPEDRANVIVLEPDGTMYANKPQLRNLFVTLNPVGGNLYKDEQGRIFNIPGQEAKPTATTTSSQNGQTGVRLLSAQDMSRLAAKPNLADPSKPYGNSGPYIRFYTTPPASTTAPGFAYESANVYLPGVTSSAINVSENPKDFADGCIYIGGWSGDAVNYDSLDFGFEHEGASSSRGLDDWYGIWKSQIGPGANPKVMGDAIRFKSNTNATLKFYVSYDANGNTQLNFVWSGVCYDFITNASLGNQTTSLVSTTGPYNWNVNGAGMILKSMTSIAQQAAPGKTADDFFDGSFLQDVVWSNCMLCRTGTGNPQAWDSYAGNGNYQAYPSDGTVSISSSSSSSASNPKNEPNRTDALVIP